MLRRIDAHDKHADLKFIKEESDILDNANMSLTDESVEDVEIFSRTSNQRLSINADACNYGLMERECSIGNIDEGEHTEEKQDYFEKILRHSLTDSIQTLNVTSLIERDYPIEEHFMTANAEIAQKILNKEILHFDDRRSKVESCLIQSVIYLLKRPAVVFIEAGVVDLLVGL